VPGSSTPPAVKDLAFPAPHGGYVDVVPSTLDLMYVALGRSDSNVKVIEDRFAKFVTECRSVYDLVVIDCHPAGSLMTKTALLNSDHVLIPVVPERYAVRGIGLMLDFIGAKQQGKGGPTPHILFNKAPRVGQSQEETEIRASEQYSDLCLTSTMKKYKAYSDPEEGKNFLWTSGKAYSVEARQNLWAVSLEFAKRIGVYYGT
jgi:chromosome partitioning protein